MVKKVLSAVALASVFAAAPAMAQTGGFTGPGATQEGTVAQLKTLPDDAHLILNGNIVRNVQGDKYEFKDGTGTVELEIDRKYWNGQNVKPENTVKLIVEVDKDLLKTEYEVDAPVEVLK